MREDDRFTSWLKKMIECASRLGCGAARRGGDDARVHVLRVCVGGGGCVGGRCRLALGFSFDIAEVEGAAVQVEVRLRARTSRM